MGALRCRRTGRLAEAALPACLLLPFLAGGIVLLLRPGRVRLFEPSAPTDSTTPFAVGIRMAGVQPPDSDDLLDGEGNLVGQMPSLAKGIYGQSSTRQLVRTFVFELPPEGADPVMFANWTIRPNGLERGFVSSGAGHVVAWRGRRLYVLTTQLQASYFSGGGFSGSRRVPLRRVDVVLRFHQGPARPARWSFPGPLKVGKTYASRGMKAGTLTILPPQSGQTVRFRFTTAARADDIDPHRWLAYDASGRRLSPASTSLGGSWGSSGINVTCGLRGIPLERIGRLVLGEQPQQRTFRNILVRWPDRAETGYPEDVGKMAQVLGRTPEDLARRRLQSLEEALAVADLARGERIRWVVEKLRSADFDALSPAQQAALRSTAAAWAQFPVEQVRQWGVELGLKWDAKGAVEAAVEMLSDDDTGARFAAALALPTARHLSAGQVALLTRRLRSLRDPAVSSQVIPGLASRKDGAGLSALRALAEAPDERPDLWMPALHGLASRGALPEPPQLSPSARARLALLGKVEAGQAAADLPALLEKVMAPAVLRDDGNARRVVENALARLDRPAAARAVVGLLRRAQREHYADEDFRRFAWRLVKRVNLWYGTDFGRFGWDPRPARSWTAGQMSGLDWPGVAQQLAEWYDAGGGQPEPSGAGEPSPAVGATLRRRVFSAGGPDRLDLDAGRALALPKDLYRAGRGQKYRSYSDLRKARDRWRRANGVDLQVPAWGGDAALSCWMTACPVPASWWATATAGQVRTALARSSGQTDLRSGQLAGLPLVAAFRTAEGLEGLLRLDPKESGRGSVVRWRAAGPAAEGAAPKR